MQEGDALFAQNVHIPADDFGVRGHNRAVVVVVGLRVFAALKGNAWVENGLHATLDKIQNVPVGELGRKADTFGRDRRHTRGKQCVIRSAGQAHGKAEARKKRMPKWVVFKQIQRARQADGPARRVVFRQGSIVKQAVVFVVVKVWQSRLPPALAVVEALALVAAQARGLVTTARKAVDGQLAGVLAAGAYRLVGRQRQCLFQTLGGQQGRDTPGRAFPRNQGRAERAHQPRDVGANNLPARLQLKAAQDRVAQKGAALDKQRATQALGVFDADDFIERVAHDGVGQTRRNVGHARALFLRLFNARVHKDCAAGAEIDGVAAHKRRRGEVFGGQVQRRGKGGQKRAAARRAGLVEQDGLDNPLVDVHTLHVLPADV